MLKKALAVLTILCLSVPSFAKGKANTHKEDANNYNGYKINLLVHKTIQLFSDKGFISLSERMYWEKLEQQMNNQIDQGMFPTFPLINFEQSMIDLLLTTHKITEGQAKEALRQAKSSGGLLINECNLLILHAELFDALITNKYLTQKEVQDLFDSCGIKK